MARKIWAFSPYWLSSTDNCIDHYFIIVIGPSGVQLLINCNYYKIQEEYDWYKLFDRLILYIQLLS